MSEETPNSKPVQTELALSVAAQPRQSAANTSRHLVTLLAIIALFVVSVLWWRNEVSTRFPQIAAGAYLGEIAGLALNSKSDAIGIYVERHAGSEEISFTLLDAEWQPQKVSLVERGVDSFDSKWSLPLTISNDKVKLRFIGSQFGETGYAGSVYDLSSGRRGSWNLMPVASTDSAQSEIGDRDLQKWLQLRAELVDVDTQISQAESHSPELSREIERLTNLISEGQALRSNADKKLRDEWDQLKNLRTQLSKKQSELRKARAQFDLSQRVTGMGRLVALSREAYEREERWLKVNLQTDTQPPSPEQQKELERAQKVAELRRKINLQEAVIAKLEGGSQGESAPQ